MQSGYGGRSSSSGAAGPEAVAPLWHLAVFVLIIAGTVYTGWHQQNASVAAAADPLASAAPPDHQGIISSWLIAAGADLLLLLFCWSGLRAVGASLLASSGVAWTSLRQFLFDSACAAAFWVVWELAAYGTYALLPASEAQAVFPILPTDLAEAVTWLFLSIVSGYCEELVFRGYLQAQLNARTGSRAAAILGQALLFGLVHAYQGWEAVLVIGILGVLYGLLAQWRGNLRANVLAHAWSDVFEGWLKFLLLPGWFPHP